MTNEADEIQRLRDDLFTARLTVLRLMPPAVQAVLKSWMNCTSREDFDRWKTLTAEQILKLADVRPAEEMNSFVSTSPRAVCPLCRESTEWFGLEGFAYPDGLLRHLYGTHRAVPCAVFTIACELALESVKLRSQQTSG
jgi:hypothetical protein